MPKLFSVSLINSRKKGTKKSSRRDESQGGLIVWGENPIGRNKVWGVRITRKQREMLVLTRKAKSILIGVLLSDGWIQRGKWH